MLLGLRSEIYGPFKGERGHVDFLSTLVCCIIIQEKGIMEFVSKGVGMSISLSIWHGEKKNISMYIWGEKERYSPLGLCILIAMACPYFVISFFPSCESFKLCPFIFPSSWLVWKKEKKKKNILMMPLNHSLIKTNLLPAAVVWVIPSNKRAPPTPLLPLPPHCP